MAKEQAVYRELDYVETARQLVGTFPMDADLSEFFEDDPNPFFVEESNYFSSYEEYAKFQEIENKKATIARAKAKLTEEELLLLGLTP